MLLLLITVTNDWNASHTSPSPTYFSMTVVTSCAHQLGYSALGGITTEMDCSQVFNQPSRPIQPCLPSMGRCCEYSYSYC